MADIHVARFDTEIVNMRYFHTVSTIFYKNAFLVDGLNAILPLRGVVENCCKISKS